MKPLAPSPLENPGTTGQINGLFNRRNPIQDATPVAGGMGKKSMAVDTYPKSGDLELALVIGPNRLKAAAATEKKADWGIPGTDVRLPGMAEARGALNEHVIDPIANRAADTASNRVKENLGLDGDFKLPPWANAAMIGAPIGAGLGLLNHLTTNPKKRRSSGLSDALTGGLLGLGAGGLLGGAGQMTGMFGGGEGKPPVPTGADVQEVKVQPPNIEHDNPAWTANTEGKAWADKVQQPGEDFIKKVTDRAKLTGNKGDLESVAGPFSNYQNSLKNPGSLEERGQGVNDSFGKALDAAKNLQGKYTNLPTAALGGPGAVGFEKNFINPNSGAFKYEGDGYKAYPNSGWEGFIRRAPGAREALGQSLLGDEGEMGQAGNVAALHEKLGPKGAPGLLTPDTDLGQAGRLANSPGAATALIGSAGLAGARGGISQLRNRFVAPSGSDMTAAAANEYLDKFRGSTSSKATGYMPGGLTPPGGSATTGGAGSAAPPAEAKPQGLFGKALSYGSVPLKGLNPFYKTAPGPQYSLQNLGDFVKSPESFERAFAASQDLKLPHTRDQLKSILSAPDPTHAKDVEAILGHVGGGWKPPAGFTPTPHTFGPGMTPVPMGPLDVDMARRSPTVPKTSPLETTKSIGKKILSPLHPRNLGPALGYSALANSGAGPSWLPASDMTVSDIAQRGIGIGNPLAEQLLKSQTQK